MLFRSEEGFKDPAFCSMCGPKFCSMKISQEVREFARLNPGLGAAPAAVTGVIPIQQVDAALQEKADEFRARGQQIYS